MSNLCLYRFIAKCNDMFFILVSVQVASSALCIVITIFALLTSEWLGGYCYLCILVSNLYLYCVLGTMLESCVCCRSAKVKCLKLIKNILSP